MLNEAGRVYRSNGYRFPADDWKDVKDWTNIPVSAEAEVEASYDNLKSGGTGTGASDLKVEELEITAGGAFGKTGRVTALVSVLAAHSETGSGTDTSIHKAFIQVNDLMGAAGEGVLNLRAGQFDIGLPFLNTVGTPISNRYFADSSVGIISMEERAVELNGSSVTADEEGFAPTHRYAAGVVREDVHDDDKLRGYYAWYSATFKERYNIGGIYRAGREAIGSVDISFDKWGVAGSMEAGPFIATAGYFRATRSALPDKSDYMAEILCRPVSRVSLSARYDTVRQKQSKGVKSQTLMARYNILSNVYAQFEYRRKRDADHVVDANEESENLRLFLTAVF